jgi:hypothetical protein
MVLRAAALGYWTFLEQVLSARSGFPTTNIFMSEPAKYVFTTYAGLAGFDDEFASVLYWVILMSMGIQHSQGLGVDQDSRIRQVVDRVLSSPEVSNLNISGARLDLLMRLREPMT